VSMLILASFRNFFTVSNHSTECASLLVNPSYIARRSWTIINTMKPIYNVRKINDKLKSY
jgi:hypothetical protein